MVAARLDMDGYEVGVDRATGDEAALERKHQGMGSQSNIHGFVPEYIRDRHG